MTVRYGSKIWEWLLRIGFHCPSLNSVMTLTATIGSNGYNTTAGKVWLLSDGGIHRSMDGGKSFAASSGLSTLATVNIGGLAIPGKTALCLNCGDNGGFYSSNGGQSWKTIT